MDQPEQEAFRRGADASADLLATSGQVIFGDVPSGRYTLVAGGYRPGVAALPAGDGHRRQAGITLARPE